jgi:uncharacterized membrane protein
MKYHELPQEERDKLKAQWRENAIITEREAKKSRIRQLAIAMVVILPIVAVIPIAMLVAYGRPIRFLWYIAMTLIIFAFKYGIWLLRNPPRRMQNEVANCIDQNTCENSVIICAPYIHSMVGYVMKCLAVGFLAVIFVNLYITAIKFGQPGQYILTSINYVLPFFVLFCIFAVRRKYCARKWIIDGDCVYRSNHKSPLFKLSEVLSAQVGLGCYWVPYRGHVPGMETSELHESFREDTLIIVLPNDNYIVWNFNELRNRDKFVQRVMSRCPRDVQIPESVISKVSISDDGKMIHIPNNSTI